MKKPAPEIPVRVALAIHASLQILTHLLSPVKGACACFVPPLQSRPYRANTGAPYDLKVKAPVDVLPDMEPPNES